MVKWLEEEDCEYQHCGEMDLEYDKTFNTLV